MVVTQNRKRFFPFFGLLGLRREREDRWTELVDWIDTLPHSDEHVIAFRLLLDRLNREQGRKRSSCRDQFCATCISETVAQYTGSEDDLISHYWKTVNEVQTTVKDMRRRARKHEVIDVAA